MPRQKLSMLTMATSVPMISTYCSADRPAARISLRTSATIVRDRDDPMDHFHGGGGERTVMVVLTLDRCR